MVDQFLTIKEFSAQDKGGWLCSVKAAICGVIQSVTNVQKRGRGVLQEKLLKSLRKWWNTASLYRTWSIGSQERKLREFRCPVSFPILRTCETPDKSLVTWLQHPLPSPNVNPKFESWGIWSYAWVSVLTFCAPCLVPLWLISKCTCSHSEEHTWCCSSALTTSVAPNGSQHMVLINPVEEFEPWSDPRLQISLISHSSLFVWLSFTSSLCMTQYPCL